jgi:hypothetical protein
MPTLGTQNISTSYPQLLKTFGIGGLDGNLQVITDGDNTSSALSLSTTGVQSTGSLAVDGTSLLTGIVTFGTSLTASTGTATIGTLSVGTATISTATIPSVTLSTATISTASISTATIPLQLGAVTFGSNITASTGTATIGTLSASTATISTATIPLQLGAVTFGSTITASTGTNTLGTISVNSATIGTISTLNGLSVTTTATVGTLEIGATGPNLTNASYGTAAFTLSTVAAYNAGGTTNGTVALTGSQVSDIVIGTLNSLGSATGSSGLIIGFHCIASNVVRYSITNPTTTAGTVPAGTLHMTALRFTT